MRMVPFLLLIVVLFASCASPPPYQARGGTRPQDVEGIRRIEIEARNSHIAVKGEDRSEVLVYDMPDSFERNGETLRLELSNSEKFRLDVPRGTLLDIENDNGSLLISGVAGDIDADLQNTEVFIINSGRRLEVETTNDAVNIVKRTGRILDYSATTTNADIHVLIPAEQLNLDLETTNGYFNIRNLPVTVIERDFEKYRGFIGSRESGTLALETTNSTITLEPVGRRSGASMLVTGMTGRDHGVLKRRLNSFIDNVNKNFTDTLMGILEEIDPSAADSSGTAGTAGAGSGATGTGAATGAGTTADGSGAAAAGAETGTGTAAAAAAGTGTAGVAVASSSKEQGSEARQQEAAARRQEDIEPKRTVVFPFEETNPPAREMGLGPALSEMLITAIANSPAVRVIERGQIDRVLDESKYQVAGLTSTEESIEIGNLLNSEIIIVGSVSRFGRRIELDVRVIRLETGEVLFTQYGSSPEEKLREMINALGGEISDSIADISLSDEAG